jgi:transporter family-2 protein
MFAMALALGFSLPVYGLPTTVQLGSAPAISYAAGLLIGFYALSATVIIPRFGAASFVALILIAQLLTSAVDEFGLFRMSKDQST